MKHSDFEVGVEFFTATGKWRCTDLGRRTVIAIRLDHPDDPSWYNGPPFAVAETVFDEYDLGGCELEATLIESLDEGEPDPDVEAAWAVEIQRRLAQLDAGTVEGIPWEQVRQQVRDQLKAVRAAKAVASQRPSIPRSEPDR